MHIEGTELLTSALGLTADLVHPNSMGHEEISNRLVEIMRKYL